MTLAHLIDQAKIYISETSLHRSLLGHSIFPHPKRLQINVNFIIWGKQCAFPKLHIFSDISPLSICTLAVEVTFAGSLTTSALWLEKHRLVPKMPSGKVTKTEKCETKQRQHHSKCLSVDIGSPHIVRLL